MAASLTRDGLDLGIVTKNEKDMLRFYAEVLGFPIAGEVKLPSLGTVRKLRCGHSQIKLLVLEAGGETSGFSAALSDTTGYRYFSLEVEHIQEILSDCRRAGCAVITDVTELRPGVRAAMVRDPDGNMIEFMEMRQS